MYKSLRYISLLVTMLILTLMIGILFGMHKGGVDPFIDLFPTTKSEEEAPKMIIEVIPEVQLLVDLFALNSDKDVSCDLTGDEDVLIEMLDQTEKLLQSYTNEQILNYIAMRSSFSGSNLDLNNNNEQKDLDQYYLSLINFSENSQYKTQNYDNHIADYTDIIYEFNQNLDHGLYDWLANFHGQSIECFNIILVPNSDRNMNLFFLKNNGFDVFYQIYYIDGSQSSVVNQDLMTIHHWSTVIHMPLITTNKELIQQLNLQYYYYPVSELMEEKNIVEIDTFLSELLARSIAAYYLRTEYNENTYISYIEYQKQQGFYMIEKGIEQIDYYMNHRDSFTDYNVFITYFIKALGNDKDQEIASFYLENSLDESNNQD